MLGDGAVDVEPREMDRRCETRVGLVCLPKLEHAAQRRAARTLSVETRGEEARDDESGGERPVHNLVPGKRKRNDKACGRPAATRDGRMEIRPATGSRPSPAGARSESWTNCGASSFQPPLLPPLHPHLVHALHEPLTHLLVAGALHRIEVTGHLLVFVLLDLD